MPTIGVSIPVPEPWGTRLQQFRVSNGDTQGKAIPTHITLVPPVELAVTELAKVEQHLGDVADGARAYGIHLRGTGTFRPVSPVVFINLVEGISQTEQLAHACRRGPLDVDLTHHYHPHVTVAHHLDDQMLDRAFDELGSFECSFTATGFHLYVLDPDRGWTATHDFALSPAEDAPED